MKVTSVCMATYDGESFIASQIDSILVQLKHFDELVIVDDNSYDRTCDIIDSYNDNRIKLIRNKKNFGYVKTFEIALENCVGDFIFLCDQDDIWFNNKIQKCKSFLINYDLVICDALVTNDVCSNIRGSYFKINRSKPGLIINLINNSYLGCCMCFRKNIISYILPFPCCLYAHDIWIGLHAEIHFNVFFLNEPLQYYRRHNNTISSSSHKSPNSIFTKLYLRFTIVYLLMIKSFKNLTYK